MIEFLNVVKDEYGCLFVVVVVGVISDMFECVEVLLEVGVDVIVIDIVYGYSVGVICKIKEICEMFFEVILIVGNVVIVEVIKVLYDVGVDVVKVGIGFGLICIICVVVGVGVF